jgi:hypothetical protein
LVEGCFTRLFISMTIFLVTPHQNDISDRYANIFVARVQDAHNNNHITL